MPDTKRRAWFWLILGAAVYAFVEFFSLWSLNFIRESKGVSYPPVSLTLSERHVKRIQSIINDDLAYKRLDALLGWSIRENGSLLPLYQANSEGIRASREYQLTPPDGVLRIATFGDSFTHCDEVPNEQTWQEILAGTQQGLEVMNFGVGGFGTDQAYLRYLRDGTRFQPDVVMIGFMSEDIKRHVNVFRPFYFAGTGIPMSKPRFILQGGELALEPNPLKQESDYERLVRNQEESLIRLGRNDWYFQHRPKEGALDFLPSVRFLSLLGYEIRKRTSPQILNEDMYNERSEAYRITMKIFDRFHRDVVKHGALPVIVLFPDRNDIRDYRMTGRSAFTRMINYFQEAGYLFIDLDEAFELYAPQVPLNELVGVHYSAEGNRIVANYLRDFLWSNDITRRPRVN